MPYPDPPAPDGELDSLSARMEFLRDEVHTKVAGLSDAEMQRSLDPSPLTLAGLINHLGLVESFWFGFRFSGIDEPTPWDELDFDTDQDAEFTQAATLSKDEVVERYSAACERSRAYVAAASGPDQESRVERDDGQRWSLRWIMAHMIDETARHLGHMDLIRESIDGAVTDPG